MYLFWHDNRWMLWKNLGQTFFCDPWWAFWTCRNVYGWIRYDFDYKCPEQVNFLWKSEFTQSVDAGIRVKGCDGNTPTTTTTSTPSKYLVV